ncbi:MAG: pyridoxal phosphate-dependent aminotransferase [Lachnospiraceae bacterium]|nr:pyridoxal phosphate-dependent aminotransferase [Lachnospiraceae bacterium]
MINEAVINLNRNGSAIRAMFEEGARLAKEFGKENVYDYSLGNPSVEPPEEVKQAMLDVLNEESPNAVHGYMNNAGYEDVRGAIAEHLNNNYGTAFSARNILMTVGAAGGLNVIFKTLLNPGDEVMTFTPFFVEYRNYVANFGGKLVTVPTDPETFMPVPELLAAAITPKTKALIINNPNNPTGVVYPVEVIEAVAKVLSEKEKEFGTAIYLIADEPYRELVYDGAEVPYLTKYYKNTIVGYSYSKSLSLPGERIGYLVMPDELTDADEIIPGASVANRVLGFVNAPSLIQRTIKRCLDAKVDVEIYNRNRELLYSKLTEYGYTCVKPQGAFYLFIKAPGGDDKAFAAAAKKYRLLLVAGTGFGGPGYLRLAYCVDYDMIVRSLPAFESLAKEYGLK